MKIVYLADKDEKQFIKDYMYEMIPNVKQIITATENGINMRVYYNYIPKVILSIRGYNNNSQFFDSIIMPNWNSETYIVFRKDFAQQFTDFSYSFSNIETPPDGYVDIHLGCPKWSCLQVTALPGSKFELKNAE